MLRAPDTPFAFTLVAVGRADDLLPLDCQVTRDPARAEWTYYARPAAPRYDGLDGYELSVVPLHLGDPGGAWRITTLWNHLPGTFHRRGIGPALIVAAAAHLGVRICSSRTVGPTPDEYRTSEADRVWRALVARDLASYDAVDDRYWLA